MMLSQKIDQMEKLLDQDENPSKHAKKMKERLPRSGRSHSLDPKLHIRR